jgi:protein-tyrosine phosphatase
MSYEPTSLYSEIIENLYMGGTDDNDVIHLPANPYAKRTDLPFDSIVTMYAWARPADWKVQEYRYGVPDARISDMDLSRLRQAVNWGFKQWRKGDRVLVRCQAGLNRSGLVTALILMKTGMSAEDAIRTIRKNRADIALFNEHYVKWLMTEGEAFSNAPSSDLPISA